MTKRQGKGLILIAVAMFSLQTVFVQSGFAGDKKKEEILRQIKKLEDERVKLRRDAEKATEKTKPTGKNLQEVIDRYEKLLQGCQVKKSSRCADVIYTLGSLYYDDGRDNYIIRREQYESDMTAWEKSGGRGPEPINPIPDYSKALKMYEMLASEYPDFPKLSEAFYQMGTIYLLMGDLDKTKDVFSIIVKKFPNSPRASGAHFRLSDLAYLEHDFSSAIKHLEKVKQEEVEVVNWEMAHYRKAEIYYNMGEFDKAIGLFHSYVEKCDAGQYPKREFRDMALEFMAISFSDMGNGAQEAINFFKKTGSKPYEAYIMYTIGMKNRTHGQFDDAIIALQTSLKKFPFYKDAPVARQMLIECFVVKKEHEKANGERERLIDDYGPGSEWYSKNSSQVAVIEQSRNEVKRALGSVAIYYHALAQKKKDKGAYEKALKRYQEFFQKFPDDKWRIYEFRYNIAEIHGSLGDCQQAAEHYNFVAMENLSTYPAFKADIDTLGMDQEEVEKKKKGTDKGPVVISQEDAGYNVIVALDNCRKKAMASNGVTDENAYSLVETKKLLEYTEKFQSRFPKSANAAEVLYLAGNIHYGAKSYDNAIRVFKQISDNYPSAKVGEKSLRMLANSYSSSGQFDLAMSMYRQLLSKQTPNTAEYIEVLDLAAGAMFKRAENLKKSGNSLGAADAFKTIYNEYPSSKVADRGWFEAGICYEEGKNLQLAASTFENLPVKFPKSTLREKSYLRAADNYKNEKQLDKAAQVYQTAANNITKAEFAIGALASASEAYQKLNQFDMAGKMYELIYERYSNDPKTPQALYNAGLIFEKGKFYSNAINVYNILANRFPNSEYAAEAFFSVGLCYEKMGKNADMAQVFSEYANKFASDRFKQVQALVKAGDAYFNMKNFVEAEKDYILAVSVFEKFRKEADIDIGSIALAYFKLGEIGYKRFENIQLKAKNEKEMKTLLKDKTKALEEPAKYYAKSIELGVEEWTVRSTYMIGMGFVEMSTAVEGQSLFGSPEEKIGSKVKILSSLDKYYQKAQEYFYKNINWAHTQNIKGEYIEKSIDKFMEMMFLRGYIMEQVGQILKSAPIPKGLSPEEREAYRQLLEEKYLEALDAALPKYEDGIKAAQELGIALSPWLSKMQDRVREINPSSTVLNIQIEEWKPKEVAPSMKVPGSMPGQPELLAAPEFRDDEYERSMRRIQNIISMEISVEDKIKQLNRIEMDAKRNAILEEEKIKDLKAQAGT